MIIGLAGCCKMSAKIQPFYSRKRNNNNNNDCIRCKAKASLIFEDDSMHSSTPSRGTIAEADDDLLYFKVQDLKLTDLMDCSNKGRDFSSVPAKAQTGVTSKYCSYGKAVFVNGEKLALFRYKMRVFAILDGCPHAGGPLHQGDIEDMVDVESVRVTCPWHGWKIDLSSGTILFPSMRKTKAAIFPVVIHTNGDIWIGFDKFNPTYFSPSSQSF